MITIETTDPAPPSSRRSQTGPPTEGATLPGPVLRFRRLAEAGGPPVFETIRLETSATIHRPRMPPIPLRITMAHRLGKAFAHDIRIGVRRLSLRFGVDAFVDGRGVMKIGSRVRSGPKFDRGALIAMWGEALSFPTSWDRQPGLRWEPVDAETALLLIPWAGETIPVAVAFDPLTGYPARCHAERFKGDGPLVGWAGLFTDWQSWPGGILAPARMQAWWDDEPAPWLDIRLERLEVDVPIEATLELGRRALAEGGL
ncbi:MAG TPA: DUF6544 family protein [Candidatus Limnocylindrales bacterium]|nr:DUF6544 family protein [Candidatus Limnocylindrales bacterium]